MSIELGPFKLIRPIGKGGMGVVWHGVHTGTGVPVAVKVITQRVSRDERTLKAFRNEVRAVAGLDHPGVVWVLDYGEVSTEASIASGRQLTEGSPYLVMEMATGGTLSAYKDGLAWSDLKGMLLGLLDALSHAHARGVIHRDLKPGNVLICSPNDLRPGLKLTDFGIAHAREETVSDSMSNHVIGTLHYMAPEQIRADWRDYGPWTDLYALGTIAYRLTTGVLPFKGKRGASLMVAQLNHRPPPLLPIHPVPDGFEDWLLTMLRKEHSRRFQTAADASMALASLVHPEMSLSRRRPASLTPGSSLGPIRSLVLDDEPHTMEILDDGGDVTAPTLPPVRAEESRPEVAPRRGEFDRLRPPVPLSWQRPSSSEEGGIQLRGAGLGLWGLRAVSLVGRIQERDAIWKALRDVSQSRQTRVAVVRGVKGVGKTALVQWLVERAVELGAAHLMRCDYGADEQPEEGLRLMLRRFFKVARLDADARRRRVIEICDSFGETDEADAVRVERTLDPVDPLATDGGERQGAIRWFLAKIAADRPLILWMDGAHQGMDGLQLVLGMLRASSARILVVLSIDDEALRERRLERSFLERIVKSPSTTVVPVEPLSEIELATHIRENLGLAAALAHEVASQSGGLPQYATQVVGEWVGKAALRRGPEGYVLVEGECVPRSMDQLWDQRIEQLLEGLPAGTERMLELAAVLGDAVNEGEWATLCDDPDGKLRASGGAPINTERVRARSLLVDRLLAAALIEERDDGWAFLVDELRGALNDRADRSGRMADSHRIVAAMLEEQGAAAERRGHHLVASGDLDAGVDALLGGVRERLAAVGPRPALALLEKASDVLDRARVPTTDPRRGRVWCTHGELAIQRGRLDEAEKRAEQVLHIEGRLWIDVHTKAYFLLGNVALLRKRAEVGREAFRGFAEAAPAGGLLLHRAAMHHALSIFAEAEGDGDTATQQARLAASTLADHNGDLLEVWKLLGMRALVSSRAGTLLVNLERRRRSYEMIGQMEGTAECWMVLASASRRGNRANLAARCLEHAARLFDRANSHAAHRPRLQLALLRCASGDYASAEREAVEVANKVRDAHRKPVLLKAHALLAVCAAGRDRWALLGDHLDVIRVLIADTGASERDVGWCMMRAGELARRRTQVGPARDCLSLALHQYQQLGDAKRMARVSKLLGSLSGG